MAEGHSGTFAIQATVTDLNKPKFKTTQIQAEVVSALSTNSTFPMRWRRVTAFRRPTRTAVTLTALRLAKNPIRVIDHLAHILALLQIGTRKEAALEAVDERVADFASGEVEGLDRAADFV